jgi:hypothetical protein
MKKCKLSKEKTVQFEEKNSIRKCIRTKSSAQRNKKFIEKPDAKWNNWRGDIRPRSCPAKFPNYKKEFLKKPNQLKRPTKES